MCKIVFFSTEFSNDGEHYCTECGGVLEITTDTYRIQGNNIQSIYYFSDDRRQRRAIALRQSGLTLDEIAAKLGVSKTTAYRLTEQLTPTNYATNAEIIYRVLNARQHGKSLRQMASEIGISRQSAANIINKYKYVKNVPHETNLTSYNINEMLLMSAGHQIPQRLS